MSGAVLLDVQTDVASVIPPDRTILDRTFRAPGPAEQWLLAASVLQAFTIHVRRERGRRFNLDTRDIDTLTVAQLAALYREHRGSAGQGFELAVADALNASVAAVTAPVQEALMRLGVPMQTPRAIVLGMEKAVSSEQLAQAVSDALGNRRLLTGSVGRPVVASRAVSKLLAAGTQITSSKGELAFADLLVFDEEGDHVVTCSVKIGQFLIDPAAPLPRLWVITGQTRTRLMQTEHRLPDRCAAACIGDDLMAVYRSAWSEVSASLVRIDRQTTPSTLSTQTNVIERVLRSRANDPVAVAVQELHERAYTVTVDGYGMDWYPVPAPVEATLDFLALTTVEDTSTALQDVMEIARTAHGFAGAVTPHRQFFTAAPTGPSRR